MGKCIICILTLLSIVQVAAATPYSFNNVWVHVETELGSGANETILVIDWNRLDHGWDTISESHAFLYRWDGDKTVADMLADFDTANILDVTFTYGGAAAGFISYYDGVENHFHIEESSWNSASTTDPFAYWGGWGDPASGWDWNQGGIDVEMLADGQFEGINATVYYISLPEYADTQLDIPIVPEPACLTFLVIGGLGLLRRLH
ncbi:MAG: hypothetical protein JW709_14310 [Sedimentisphaerales bacterium]|nr:hypothetical protein [Sedimentisphaerales bacterium]